MQQLFLLHTITLSRKLLFLVGRYTFLVRFISGYQSAAGLMIALAIGDALGAPFEGSQRSKAMVTQMLPGGRHSRKKGAVTDDTLQAVAVAESLTRTGGFELSDLVNRLIEGYKIRPEWYGPTSTAFFNLVESGTLPHKAAWLVHKKNKGSRSNGSVMRGFPIGIRYPAEKAYEISIACSRVTHYDPVPGHCSAFLNVMVSDMCRGFSRKQAFRHARSHCINPEVHAVLGNYDQYDPDPSLDSVLCSHAALHSFMHAKTLEMAVLTAVNLGGDADTVGACCGALAGALWGLDAVPERWKRDFEGYDDLLLVAGNLFEQSKKRD
jgi:ADP-ribosyl-[dinitrogen reductase] hydrolase